MFPHTWIPFIDKNDSTVKWGMFAVFITTFFLCVLFYRVLAMMEGGVSAPHMYMALWDIKGKIARMPVYSLLGGKSRHAIPVYRHADGNSLGEVVENIEGFYEEGYKYQRIQVGIYGGLADSMNTPPGSYPEEYFDAEKYVDDTLRLF